MRRTALPYAAIRSWQEQVIGDEEANRLLRGSYRAPYIVANRFKVPWLPSDHAIVTATREFEPELNLAGGGEVLVMAPAVPDWPVGLAAVGE